MHRLLIVLLVSAGAFAAPRPVVDSYSPREIYAGSGERYISITGSNFTAGGQQPLVRFSGPAGEFSVAPNSIWGFEPQVRIQVWIPQEVVVTAGTYLIVVHNDTAGDSDPFSLRVSAVNRILVHTPPYVAAQAVGPEGAVVTYEAWAESTDGEPVDFGCAPASGSQFPLGPTKVTCTGSTEDGNTRSQWFTVTVYDSTPPVLTVPREILIRAVDRGGADVEYEVSAVDIVDPEVRVTCSPASGSHFAMGTTEVRCEAVDDSYNWARGSFEVTVSDAAFPVLTVPDELTGAATSWSGAILTYEASAIDYAGRPLEVYCAPASGTLFPIGNSTATCYATDDMERMTSRTFHVTVTPPPYAPPRIVVPDDINVEATGPDGATVTFTATATDYADRPLPVTCTPPSGSLFPVGDTNVYCSATDDRDQSWTRSFLVRVTAAPQEHQPPSLVLPGHITAEAETPDGAVVTFTATAYDEQEGALPVTCTPASGATFPIGTTVVTCSATNSHGTSATGTFEVRVVDMTAPVILSIEATPNRLWPANKRLVNVVVTVNAADDGDAEPVARIVSVSVSEAVSDTDWRILDDLRVALRADRKGKEQSRVYTLLVEVRDSSGNLATGTVDVIVPHDGSDSGTTQLPTRRRSARH